MLRGIGRKAPCSQYLRGSSWSQVRRATLSFLECSQHLPGAALLPEKLYMIILVKLLIHVNGTTLQLSV